MYELIGDMAGLSQEQFEQALQAAVAAQMQQLQQQVLALQAAFQNMSTSASSSPTPATQLGTTGFVDSKIGKLPNLRDEQCFVEWALKTTAFVAS